MKRVIVVGGGITGLAAAIRLKKQAERQRLSLDVQLLEASPRLGGSLHSASREGFLLEGGPDCFLSVKARGLEFCRELGLADDLIDTRPENRRSFIVRGGRLHPVPEGFYLMAPSRLRPFLSSGLISWRGKWRAMAEPLCPSRPQSDESLASFVRRRIGREVLDWLAQPLLAGIYSADPERLSLQATFPQFLEMEQKYGSVLVGLAKRDPAARQASGARYSLFASLRGGMETLARRAVEKLSGVALKTRAPARALRRSADGWEIVPEKGETLRADGVCLALPAHRCAALLAPQNKPLAGELDAIPYSTSITINLAFEESAIRHPLDGIGFVTPAAEKQPAIACTFAHRKFSGRAPPGKALLRAFVGGDQPPALFQRDDKELERLALQDLAPWLGITQPPLFRSVERWPRAMPQYVVGHLRRILHIEEMLLGMPGLALAGNWLRGVGIPDCIESGERAADALIETIQRPDHVAAG